MNRSFLNGILFCLVAAAAPTVFGKGGGGHGGPGGGQKKQNQNSQPTPEELAEQTREKADKSLDDGFAALKAFDTASALEDFSDVIQLEPDDALAHIGMGLARAQKGKFAASMTEFSTAMSYARKAKDNPKPIVAAKSSNQFFANQLPDPNKPDPSKIDPKAEAEATLRLATFDLAVAYSRGTEKPHALVLIDRLMAEKKPADEMMVNAQRSLIATLDDKAPATIGALPAMLKDLETANAFLRVAHAPLRRWGVTWMDSNEVTRHRTSRETEPLPSKLPFFLPEYDVLPEGNKPDAELVNPLLPIVIGSPGSQPSSSGTTPPARPLASPAAGAAPVTTPTSAPTTSSSGPAKIAAAPTAPVTRPAPMVERTITGAAFAVAPDMLLTVGRLAVGAKSLSVQSVEGSTWTATLVASDDATGMALIKAEGGHFQALPLASAARPGPVSVAAFTKPGVFGPEMQVLPGELTSVLGLWSLHVSTHPRSPGSPVVNAQGQVVAVLVATRDDAMAKLPVVTIDAVRKFVDGKIPAAPAPPAGAAPSAQLSVLELSATKEE